MDAPDPRRPGEDDAARHLNTPADPDATGYRRPQEQGRTPAG